MAWVAKRSTTVRNAVRPITIVRRTTAEWLSCMAFVSSIDAAAIIRIVKRREDGDAEALKVAASPPALAEQVDHML
jgi:hypothetical protein